MVILSGVLYLISELTLRETVEFLGLPKWTFERYIRLTI